LTEDSSRRGILTVCAAAVLIVAALLLWHYSPLGRFAQPRELVARLESIAALPWAPAAMIGLFIAGGLLCFPLMVLITCTATLFHPLSAFCISLVGSVLSAVVSYLVAQRFLHASLKGLFSSRIEKLSAAFQRQGILTIAAVRMLPIGPFTVVNLAAGTIGLRMRDYVIGTALGLAPGTAAITAFGAQLRALIEHPDPKGVLILAAIVTAWIAASFGLQRIASRRGRREV